MNAQGSGDGLRKWENSNIYLDADNSCSGDIVGNCNVVGSARGTHMYIRGNTNCQLNSTGGTLYIQYCSNASVRGQNNFFDISGNSCVQISGNGNTGRIFKNSSVVLRGNSISSVNISNSLNVDVSRSYGTVEVDESSNVQIIGDNHNVRVKNVSNLEIQSANESNGRLENKLHVIESNNRSGSFLNINGISFHGGIETINGVYINGDRVDINGTLGGVFSNLKFKAQYVSSGSVTWNYYVLGRFSFQIRPPASSSNYMFIDVLNQEDFSFLQNTSESVTIRPNNGGNEHDEKLIIFGPKIALVVGQPTISIRIQLSP